MCKEEYIKRYGEEAYLEYKKKQKALAKRWRENNRSKSRKYALDYYYRENKTRISAVYKIVNEITNDFYVGSSDDVNKRWTQHQSPSAWKRQPNSPMYQDMQKYGVENFRFQILAPVISEHLKQVEQEFIDMLHPTYNINSAKVTDGGKDASKKYFSRICSYNGETLTLGALFQRFRNSGIKHPAIEAKKYLLNQ